MTNKLENGVANIKENVLVNILKKYQEKFLQGKDSILFDASEKSNKKELSKLKNYNDLKEFYKKCFPNC